MRGPDLREAWADLRRRRANLADTLATYGDLLEAWAVAEVDIAPLSWSPEACRERWARGIPLLADAAPALDPSALEPTLACAMEVVAGVRADTAEALRAFAEAWDRQEITPAALLPGPGTFGRAGDRVSLEADLMAFIATVALRPTMQAYLSACRAHLADGNWPLGVCPFCGGPPGFSDVGEDGRRRLACHLCGGMWPFARLQCPCCGNADSKTLGLIRVEGADEGYVIATCEACRAYVKELDRRVRWNGGPALVEDWGSPHLDLVAQRRRYWRPVPPLVVAGRAPPR